MAELYERRRGSPGWLGALTLISAGLLAYAVIRLRAETRKGSASKTVSRLASWLAHWHTRFLWWRPGPSWTKIRCLWREWRRGRPSRLAGVVWGLFIVLSVAGVVTGIVTIARDPDDGSEFLMFVAGLHATFGLLLLSLFAPTCWPKSECGAALMCS